MAPKFKLILFFVAFCSISAFAGKGHFSKDIHHAFLTSKIESLNMVNKYGQITISDQGGDSITIDVTITVENATESKAEYLMDQIEINVRQSGSSIYAETGITDNFKTKQDFSINYNVNIPSDRNLNVSNKYGNVVVEDLNAKGEFKIGYGNMTAGSLIAPEKSLIRLELAYSKADFQAVNNLNCEMKYSKLFIDKIDNLVLESKYSGISIDEVTDVKFESKYDGFSFDEITSLKGESKYTHYNIDELKKTLVLNSEYGTIDVDEVAPGFELIEIESSYGGIKLGIEEESYKLNAECTYCGISYPMESFVGNKIKDNHLTKIDGVVGSGKGSVKITSRYGGIKLED